MKLVARIVLGLAATGILTILLLIGVGVQVPFAYPSVMWLAHTTGTLGQKTAIPAAQQFGQTSVGLAGELMVEKMEQETLAQRNSEAQELEEKSRNPESTTGSALKKAEEAETSKTARTKQDEKQQDEKKQDTYQSVSDNYFLDALFIGDSRTVGMQQSGLMENAAYYAKTGIGIGAILHEAIVPEAGTKISVERALELHKGAFGKVYIMIGINDMQNGDVDWFLAQYQELLQAIRRTQPQAVIYIQGNIPMSSYVQDFSGALNNTNLSLRNEASRKLADGQQIFYLETDGIYADEYGNLNTSYTSDGLHVRPAYYDKWVTYLKGHAIVR